MHHRKCRGRNSKRGRRKLIAGITTHRSSNLQTHLGREPSFLADGMLGSTARKLRILGFDTAYDGKSNDVTLIQESLDSSRVLLTSDVELFFCAKRMNARAILISGRTEEERLFQVLSIAGVKQIQVSGLESRCSVCNGRLSGTASRNSNNLEIYRCEVCWKSYWRGSHWKKMRALFDTVNIRLSRLQEPGLNE
jgi:uncharacterized protein